MSSVFIELHDFQFAFVKQYKMKKALFLQTRKNNM